MGLPAAIKAHKINDLQTAKLHYQRALNQGDHKDFLFQNYGALLRELGKIDEAKEIYRKGLEIYPDHEGILLNFANILKEDKPWEAFAIHLRIFSIYRTDPRKRIEEKHFLSLIITLYLNIVFSGLKICIFHLNFLAQGHPSLLHF